MVDKIENGVSSEEEKPISVEMFIRSKNDSPISKAFENFLARIEDIREAAFIAGPAIGKWQINELTKCKKLLEKYNDGPPDNGEIRAVAKGAHAASDLIKISKEHDRLLESKAIHVLMRSLFVGIFSEYDVFIGDLIQAIHEKKPDLFKNIRREITLSELLEFASVDAVKQDILEKEIDSFRRNSYVEQFAELENKFDVKTLRNFPEWPAFVELGQRRNLLTHNGGVCSDQYISVCDRVGFKWIEKPKSGDELSFDGKYFGAAIRLVTKVAFMLTHTLWRKILPDETAIADKSMNDTIFEILSKERWIHASEFANFGLSEPMVKKTSDIDKRIRVINSAIALMQLKRQEEAIKILNSLDWTASVRDFQLAICVLKNEYGLAADLMKKIGKEGEVIFQLAYHNWPLFQEFRDRPEFHDAYESVYGIPFIEKAKEEVQAKVVDSGSSALVDGGSPPKVVAGRGKKTKKISDEKENPTAAKSVAKTKPRTRISSMAPKRALGKMGKSKT